MKNWKLVTLRLPGDVVCVPCPVHGKQAFIAGLNVEPSKEEQLITCPYCQPVNPSGGVGDSFKDSRGVLYVVDTAGNYRVFSKLGDAAKKRIKAARDKRIADYLTAHTVKEAKSGKDKS